MPFHSLINLILTPGELATFLSTALFLASLIFFAFLLGSRTLARNRFFNFLFVETLLFSIFVWSFCQTAFPLYVTIFVIAFLSLHLFVWFRYLQDVFHKEKLAALLSSAQKRVQKLKEDHASQEEINLAEEAVEVIKAFHTDK